MVHAKADRRKVERLYRCPVTEELIPGNGESYTTHDVLIYVVQAGPFFKIGWSVDPMKRIDEFRNQPHTPELLGYVWGKQSDEKHLHALLTAKGLRMRGEWFHVDTHSIRLVAWLLGHRSGSNLLSTSLNSFSWDRVGL